MIIKLRRSIYILLGLLSYLIPKRSYRISVLCYHSIDSTNWSHGISKSVFEKQINYLSKKHDFWNLYDLLDFINNKKSLDRDKVIITFDDGYKNIKQVLDITDKYDVKPTVFVISDSNSRNYEELENNKRLLSDIELKKLISHGWTVGSHTSTHPNLKNVERKRLSYEIKKSKLSLEKRLKIKCDFIAYPKGKYTQAVLNNVAMSGYEMGLTMDDGFINLNTSLFKIPRIGINRTHSEIEFKYLNSFLNVLFRKIVKYHLYE